MLGQLEDLTKAFLSPEKEDTCYSNKYYCGVNKASDRSCTEPKEELSEKHPVTQSTSLYVLISVSLFLFRWL